MLTYVEESPSPRSTIEYSKSMLRPSERCAFATSTIAALQLLALVP
ncbi:hypothetical protein GBAR_LOCUS3193 [Geodia barretti]|uniref:Uncharacterized protein n=1 Tax=Geodia barretti TaxID=519541 RepID=A0AA35R286_GEOBA|nr:hypothetical protein GBAR_LOCUS3193 [Geodia barretti]